MSRRKDTYVRDVSLADIQDLYTIAVDSKEKIDYVEAFLKRRIAQQARQIKIIRQDFKSFLNRNNINTSYPEFSQVFSEDVRQDTEAEQATDIFPVERFFGKSYTDFTMQQTAQILRDKYPTLQSPIGEYQDRIKTAKMNKAMLENKLEGLNILRREYKSNIDVKRDQYEAEKSNLEKLKALKQNILEFEDVFGSLPSGTTSEQAVRYYLAGLGGTNPFYAFKKRKIKKMADRLVVTYAPGEEVETNVDTFKEVFKQISDYFGGSEDFETPLPSQYVDALNLEDKIIEQTESFLEDIDGLIESTRAALDSIREVSGIGNATVENLIAASTEIAQSPVTARYIERTTLDEVTIDNEVLLERAEQDTNRLKRWLATGVGNVSDTLSNISKNAVRKMALVIGVPIDFVRDKFTNLQDHLREDIRDKYGGDIPFCDEVTYTDITGEKRFIKESEIDPETGRPKTEVNGDIYLEETLIPRDIQNV